MRETLQEKEAIIAQMQRETESAQAARATMESRLRELARQVQTESARAFVAVEQAAQQEKCVADEREREQESARANIQVKEEALRREKARVLVLEEALCEARQEAAEARGERQSECQRREWAEEAMKQEQDARHVAVLARDGALKVSMQWSLAGRLAHRPSPIMAICLASEASTSTRLDLCSSSFPQFPLALAA